MNNKCIKEVGWWVFKTKIVLHTFKMYAISKFMSSSETFHTHYKCKDCGITKVNKFVEKDQLLLKGISPEVIENITSWYSLEDV